MKHMALAALVAVLLALAGAASAGEYCFFKSERVDGLNKICTYSCPSGAYARTIKSYELCGPSVTR